MLVSLTTEYDDSMPLQSNLPEPSLAVFPGSYADARALWRQQLSSLVMPVVQHNFSARQVTPEGRPLVASTA